MTTRTYRLGKRQADVDDTRGRIIAAASDLFAQPAFYQVTLDDVAKRAGVARATVYYQFESKVGLLDAVITAMVQRITAGLQPAREHPNAALAVGRYVKEVVAFLSKEDALLRNVYALTAVEPDVAEVVRAWELRRKELLTWLVKRLDDQGRLRPGVTQRFAVDVLWMLTNFRSYDQLRVRSGLTVRDAAALLSNLAVDAVVAPAAEPASAST